MKELILKLIIGLCIGLLLVIPIYLIWQSVMWHKQHPCIQSHRGIMHHPAWTQLVTTSVKPLIMIPIFHPAYNSEEEICDKHKP